MRSTRLNRALNPRYLFFRSGVLSGLYNYSEYVSVKTPIRFNKKDFYFLIYSSAKIRRYRSCTKRFTSLRHAPKDTKTYIYALLCSSTTDFKVKLYLINSGSRTFLRSAAQMPIIKLRVFLTLYYARMDISTPGVLRMLQSSSFSPNKHLSGQKFACSDCIPLLKSRELFYGT